MAMNILLVAIGGGVGSTCRYLASLGAARLFGTAFPWGTLLVNLLGCLLIGSFFAMAERSIAMGASSRLFFVTGFLGGLTTFSSYALETVNSATGGIPLSAVANIMANNAAGLGLVLVGMAAVRHWA